MQKAKFWLPIHTLFTADGRMSRLQYLVYGILMMAIFFAVITALIAVDALALDENGNAETLPDIIVNGLIQLVMAYCLFCLAGKRMHDLGWPVWLTVFLLFDIPADIAAEVLRAYDALPPEGETLVKIIDGIGKLASLGLGVALTFSPGQKGANTYGPDPLRPPAPPVDVF